MRILGLTTAQQEGRPVKRREVALNGAGGPRTAMLVQAGSKETREHVHQHAR